MMSTATCSKASPAADIIAAIDGVIKDAPRPVALHEPLFRGREKEYVASCIETGWVSSAGSFVDRFERELAACCGARHAVVVVNGTCALHAALCVLGVKPGDEVLVPSLTFVATANAVSHAGGVPHFVEVEEISLGIDPIKLRTYLASIAAVKNGAALNKKTGRVIRALVPVHIFGHPCQTEALKAVADEFHLSFIEDASEALGSLEEGRPVGSKYPAVFSFNGNKIITTGGGGAVVMQDEALWRRLKHLTTTARTPHAWAVDHDEAGWNYRLPNLNAALGCAQLEALPRFVAAKRVLAERYLQAFAGMPGLHILKEPAGTASNYWLVALVAEHGSAAWLRETLDALHEAGLHCRPLWTPLHRLPMYKEAPRADLSTTERMAESVINLPSGVALGLPYV